MNSERAKRLHAVISEGRKLIGDKTASITPELFSRLRQNGELIETGTRINWNGRLKRAAGWEKAEA